MNFVIFIALSVAFTSNGNCCTRCLLLSPIARRSLRRIAGRCVWGFTKRLIAQISFTLVKTKKKNEIYERIEQLL